MSQCAVCGAPARPEFRAPAAEMAPDLDMRPGEPARSTLPRWIATCRGCGAAAPYLARLPPEAAAVIQTAAYKAVHGPGRAARRWAMICEAAGRRQEAAEALLQASWALDDAGEDAAALRRQAAALWNGDGLRLVDVLRRAGAFTEAEQATRQLDPAALDENSAHILDYQRRLIAAKDPGRHLISSALRPPAHNPHAAHGKPAPARSFWGRLLGR